MERAIKPVDGDMTPTSAPTVAVFLPTYKIRWKMAIACIEEKEASITKCSSLCSRAGQRAAAPNKKRESEVRSAFVWLVASPLVFCAVARSRVGRFLRVLRM
ncbi:unnamed protein product [Musa hybrid cultivar]